MPSIKKTLLVLAALCVQAHSRLLPQPTSFTKELTYLDKRIILSSSPDVVTESESFLYAVCDTQEKTFKENRCNVTVETPAFNNASYREMCIVNFAPANRKLETLTKLTLHPFTDDKVILGWAVKDHDWHTKTVQVRVLHMSDCQYHDVPILADKLHGIVPYDNTFDVVIQAFNKGLCGSESCKITYNSEGKKVNGPTQFMSGPKPGRLAGLVAAAPHSALKGYYALSVPGNETERVAVLQSSADGRGAELLKTGSATNVRISNAHELLGVCWASESTNVTCQQYDGKMAVKFKTTIVFLDESRLGAKRWIRPHNLQEGGMLLLTGASSGKDSRRFESFSVVRIHQNGRRDRPLEIDGLDFECLSAAEFRVNVSENDEEEFCFHFVCERGDFDQKGIRNTIKFSTKCLPKKYAALIKRRVSLN